MRKIDKTGFRAKKFIAELDTFFNINGNHPNYGSGPFRDQHYNSVHHGLLICQAGICAYTESSLDLDYQEINVNTEWIGDEFTGTFRKVDADIEHFDPNLKSNRGWEIGNLFLARVFINRDIKGAKPTYSFFNPGDAGYSPEKYLKYNYKSHRFVPNPELEFDDVTLPEQVQYMIDLLGLNNQTILSDRKDYLRRFETDIVFGSKTYEEIRDNELKKYFTAFYFSESELRGN